MILILLAVFLFFSFFGFWSLYFLVDDCRSIVETRDDVEG